MTQQFAAIDDYLRSFHNRLMKAEDQARFQIAFDQLRREHELLYASLVTGLPEGEIAMYAQRMANAIFEYQSLLQTIRSV